MAKKPIPILTLVLLVALGGACGDDATTPDNATTTVAPAVTEATVTVTTTAATLDREPRTATILVLPAAFTPAGGAVEYENNGSDMHVISGSLTFFAPLSFAAPLVTLDSLTIIAYDNTPGANVCVTLARSSPLLPQLLPSGQVCTGDGPALPQVRTIADLDPRQVDTASQGAFLFVSISGPGPSLAGVQVTYSY